MNSNKQRRLKNFWSLNLLQDTSLITRTVVQKLDTPRTIKVLEWIMWKMSITMDLYFGILAIWFCDV